MLQCNIMLYGADGQPIKPEPVVLKDPVYDPAVESGPYVLPNVRTDHLTPELRADLAAEIERARTRPDARLDSIDDRQREINLDAFANELTGLGTVWGDKTLGGLPGGPCVRLYRIRGPEAEAMVRGSDLGANIVNKIPDEMTREGWRVEVQPTDDEQDLAGDRRATLDACVQEPHRAAAAWRREAARRPRADAARCYAIARRWDEFPEGAIPRDTSGRALNGPVALPPAPPGPLPKLNDEGIELARAVAKWDDEVGTAAAFNQALRYERCFGGGAILIGVDEEGPGRDDLTIPLDPARVKRVTHLTPLSGGWDGETVMWRPYNDPRKPKYGLPEVYQVRNLSVQLSRPPAPGESRPVRQLIPQGQSGPTIFYVHESRLLIFDGEPASRQARQEMRGWGDSIFTRAKEVLAQFDQTWNAVASLMQEFSIINMAIDGYSALLASKNPADRDILLKRARDLQLIRSVARMNVYDAKDKVERMNVSMAGVPELLDGPLARRLAACADEPVSLLFGQVVGAIGGGAGESERTNWHATIASRQNQRMVPQLTRLYDLVWRSKEGPTRGKVPERWSVVPNPLSKPTPSEQADVRLKTAQADEIEIRGQVVTPEEVAATRYGGPEYNPGPIVLDLEGRSAASARAEAPGAAGSGESAAPAPPANGAAPAPAPGPSGSPGAAAPRAAVEQRTYQSIPPMTAMPVNPITGDPQAVPSEVRQTGNRGEPVKPA